MSRAKAELGLPDEERHGRRRGGGAPAASASAEEGTSCGCLARQREKRTSVPESAMAVAAMARPAWELAEDEDDDGAIPRAARSSSQQRPRRRERRGSSTAQVERAKSVRSLGALGRVVGPCASSALL